MPEKAGFGKRKSAPKGYDIGPANFLSDFLKKEVAVDFFLW